MNIVKYLNKLSGWYRLLIVLSVLYLIPIVTLGIMEFPNTNRISYIFALLAIWLLPVAGVVLLIHALIWVYKGFKDSNE